MTGMKLKRNSARYFPSHQNSIMNRSTEDELQATITDMVMLCKGIFAADESASAIAN